MARQKHFVQQLLMDIRTTDQQSATRLQDRISLIVNQQLMLCMDDVLSELAPGHPTFSFDRLELDVGTITLDRLETDLPALVANALRAQLAGLLADRRRYPVRGVSDYSDSIRLLHYFLLNGRLPWQFNSGSTSLAAIWQDALRVDPKAFRQVLVDLGQRSDVRRRLAVQFSDDQLAELIRLLEPGASREILLYLRAISQVHARSPVVAMPRTEFRPVVNELALTYLLANRGTRFNTANFIENQVRRLAARYNLRYAELVKDLAESIPAQSSVGDRFGLPMILRDLYRNEYRSRTAEAGGLDDKTDLLPNPYAPGNVDDSSLPPPDKLTTEWLRYWLKNRSLPFSLSTYDQEEALLRFINELPQEEKRAFSIAMRKAAGIGGELVTPFLVDSELVLARRKGKSQPNTPHRIRDLVFYWLLYQKAPWWYTESITPDQMSRFLTKTLHQFKRQTLTFIRVHRARPLFLASIASLATEQLIDRLVNDLANPAYRKIGAIYGPGQFRRVAAHLSPVQSAFLKEALLHVHLAGPSSAYELETALQTVARRYNLPWRSLLRKLLTLTTHFPALQHDPFWALVVTAWEQEQYRMSKPDKPVPLEFPRRIHNALEPVLSFLQTGTPAVNAPDTPPAALLTALLATHGSAIWSGLKPYLTHPLTRNRLLDLLTYNQFLVLLKTLHTWQYRILESVLNDWQKLVEAGLVQSGVRPTRWFEVVLIFIQTTHPSAFTSRKLVEALLTADGRIRATGKLADRQQAVKKLLAAVRKANTQLTSTILAQLTVLAAFKPDDKTLKPAMLKNMENLIPQPEPTETVYIENAGLVLLWPFLSMLFTRLNYLTERQFTSPGQAERAVHLLHFMATGEEQAPEFKLVLNKLLCNVKQGQPLQRDVALTTEELDMGENLLRAVIAQWSILKNTSIDGLRQSFLMRQGKLEWLPEQIILTVDSRAYDMLLDQRPWPISTIRLPWMDKPISVLWR